MTTPNHEPVIITPRMADNCLRMIADFDRLAKLTGKELVAEVLETNAADYAVVIEMMNRLDPGWAGENWPCECGAQNEPDCVKCWRCHSPYTTAC